MILKKQATIYILSVIVILACHYSCKNKTGLKNSRTLSGSGKHSLATCCTSSIPDRFGLRKSIDKRKTLDTAFKNGKVWNDGDMTKNSGDSFHAGSNAYPKY